MPSIAKRDNGKWRARYRDEGGKEHARHFPRKVDAQRWLDEVTASLVTGQYVDPNARQRGPDGQGRAIRGPADEYHPKVARGGLDQVHDR